MVAVPCAHSGRPRLGAGASIPTACLRLPCTARAQPAIHHQHQRGCANPPPASASRPCPQILQAAVCPERRRGFDGALSALASVTEVRISNDLQVAKVYLSIYRWAAAAGGTGLATAALGGRLFDGSGTYGQFCAVSACWLCPCKTVRTVPCRSDDVGKAAAMEGLQKLEGYVRRHIGKQVRLAEWCAHGPEMSSLPEMPPCLHPTMPPSPSPSWKALGGKHVLAGQVRFETPDALSVPPPLPASPPAPQIRLRLTPEIRFVQDDSIERSERIFKLLDQVCAGPAAAE